MYHKKIFISNLDVLQKEVRGIIPDDFTEVKQLGYLGTWQETRSLILSLPSIQSCLSELGLDDDKISIVAILNCTPQSSTPIHLDNGPYKISLNIPIQHCDDTYVYFYKTKVDPQKKFNGQNNYFRYEETDCELDEKVETNQPYLLDTMTPHKVVNNTNNTRIMLLVRMTREINFDYFDHL